MEEKTIIEHITDLRKSFLWIILSLVIIFVGLFFLSPFIIKSLISYLGISQQNIVSLTPFDGINVRLGISGKLTLLIAVPLLLFGLYRFVKPTMPDKIKKRIKYYILGILVIGIVGMFFGIFIFSKIVLNNLINNYQIVTPMWGILSLINFVFMSGISLAFVMQIIIVIPILNDVGILSVKKLKEYRLFVLLGMFVVSALITPPDVLSQFLMMIPFYGSFELGMLLAKIKFKEVKK